MSAETPVAQSAPRWQRGRVSGWVFATDHKQIGVMWLAVAAVAATVAGILAVFTGIQTATSGSGFLGEGTFVSLLTMEETLLQWFTLVPIVVGLAVYLVPLQVGARGIALPGTVSIAFWLAAFGGLAVVLSPFGAGDAPRSWWTTVPGLAVDPSRGSEGPRLIGLFLLGFAVLLTAAALLLTLQRDRAPGMTLERLPLFAQAAGLYAIASLVLAPVLLLATGLLLLARNDPGTFDWYLGEGGLARGWGWLFGQGLVTVALVPAVGAAGEVVAAFARGPLPSRTLVTRALVVATVALALLPSADDVAGKRWAAVLALVASVPLVVAVLALLSTRIHRRGIAGTPVPFAVGGLALVLVGVVAAALLALRHDDLAGTAFATARVEALWTGGVLALAGALVYWWPKLFGRLLDPRLAGASFAIAFCSALLLVLGRAVAGEQGQPARTGTVVDDAGAASLVASIGTWGLVLGLAVLALAILKSVNGRRAGNDPWQADTLEWFTTSPPPPGNFDNLPPVGSERPLADLRDALKEKGAL